MLDGLGYPTEVSTTPEKLYQAALDDGMIDKLEDESKIKMLSGSQIRFTKDPITLSKLKYADVGL